MTENPLVQPHLTVLSSAQIARIHAYTLKILSTVGVRVDSLEARQIFTGAQGASFIEDDRVLLQPELVEWAIQATPASVDIYNRLGDPVCRLGEDRPRFGIGVTNLFYQDPMTDEVTRFSRDLRYTPSGPMCPAVSLGVTNRRWRGSRGGSSITPW